MQKLQRAQSILLLMCHTTFFAFVRCQHHSFHTTSACDTVLHDSLRYFLAENSDTVRHCPRSERTYSTDWWTGFCAACLGQSVIEDAAVWLEALREESRSRSFEQTEGGMTGIGNSGSDVGMRAREDIEDSLPAELIGDSVSEERAYEMMGQRLCNSQD